MLARYKMYRFSRPADDPLPDGIRKDTRWKTKHCLAPPRPLVETYLSDISDAAWAHFEVAYLELLEQRYADDPGPFEKLAAMAMEKDLFIGCSCPTQKNPNPMHCHTVPALRFLSSKFPDIEIQLPRP
ncbi:MAG: hypothetical protein QGF67_13515 [Lentisphaeria bacterium]|jgi:hypothetical protein|nr:hypothetical protein [Lentisphaeria bacterium]